MRAVVQRVSRARVTVAGETVGEIGRGVLVLLGVRRGDGPGEVRWMAEKVTGLRIFEDSEGKMNLALADAGGAALVVSQFTLYGDCQKGRRPSFTDAAPPAEAEPLYDAFLAELRSRGVPTAAG
ncbi:MAG TPA: D-aminoacyl-tRNA deacylase, partial [Gemmataceae bacterium]